MVAFSLIVALAAASVVAAQSPAYGQCGGQGWTGPTTCVSGYTCTYSNPWYSQCLPGVATSTSTSTTTSRSTSTGTSTSPTSTGTTTPGKGVYSTDFENVDTSIWGIIATAQSGGSATVDTSKAHSGSRSLKVVSTGGYSNHVLYGLKNLTKLGSGDIYGRYYANFQNALTQEHTTHMVMTDPSAQYLRMGGQFAVLDWNRASDDSIMPDGSPQQNAGSTPIAANTWYCIEFHLGRSSGQIETWVNGNALPALTTPQTRWGTSYKPNPQDWGLGWESYGGAANTVWYDDLALGNSRIGC